MVKFKSKIKSQQLTVMVKLSFGEAINQREIELLSVKPIRGFLKPTQIKARLMEYTGPQGIMLEQYIKNKLTSYEFYYIMAQIVEMFRKVERNRLFLRNVILDLKYVYINPNTKELQFIYLPMMSNNGYVDIRAFMEEIIYSAFFDERENLDYIPQYLRFLRSMEVFSAEKLERYIARMNQQIARQIKSQNMGQSGFMTNKRADYYKHYDNCAGEDATLLLDEEFEDTSLLEEEYGETSLLDEEYGATTLLDEDYEGTCLLLEEVSYPYLIRKSNDEKISLNKPVFRIGKEESYVDYFVQNNPAVSRSHADIITRGDRCFVYDQNSTNKSYINNVMLPVKVETEIFDGDTLKLANEEFVFYISE